MFKILLMSKYKFNTVLKVFIKYNSSKKSIRLTELFSKHERVGLEESGEILNLSNNSANVNIPRSYDVIEKSNYLKNDIVNVSLNERATLNLSSNTYANFPEPPVEAVNINDRPYDSLMTLGSSTEKNAKHISEELVTVHNVGLHSYPHQLNRHEHELVSEYLSNEKRFGIKYQKETNNSENFNVLRALEYQYEIMEAVEQNWRKMNKNCYSQPTLFLRYPSELNQNIDDIIDLLEILDIDNKDEHIKHFRDGQVPLFDIMEIIDNQVRIIVDKWRESTGGSDT